MIIDVSRMKTHQSQRHLYAQLSEKAAIPQLPCTSLEKQLLGCIFGVHFVLKSYFKSFYGVAAQIDQICALFALCLLYVTEVCLSISHL